MGRAFIFIILLFAWIFYGTFHWTCFVNNDCKNGFLFWDIGSNSTKIENPNKEKFTFKNNKVNGPSKNFSIIADGLNVKSNENISFDINGYNPNVPMSVQKQLLKVKSYLLVNKNNKLNIVGYYRKSDKKPARIADLGLARANAVKAYLLKQRFNANQINVSSALVNNPIILDNKIVDGISFNISKVKTVNNNKTKISKNVNANINNAIVKKPNMPIVNNVKTNVNTTKNNKTANTTNNKPTSTIYNKNKVVKAKTKKQVATKLAKIPFSKSSVAKSGSSYLLNNVNFKPKSLAYENKSFAELYTLVSFLQRNRNVKIEIGCNVKNTNNSSKDLQLSEKRATALKYFLIGKGIVANRLTSKGYGSSLTKNSDKVQFLIK